MAPKEALRALQETQQDLDNNPPVNVVLGSRPPGQEADDLRRLNIGDELQRQFQRIARNAVHGELRVVEYEPGYKPDSGEICWIDLEEAPNVAAMVKRIAAFQNLVMFDGQQDQFTDNLAYYALLARATAMRNVALFRKTSEKLELGRSNRVAAWLREGQYDSVKESMLLFDHNIDCWSDGRYMLISNVPNFEKVFNYLQELQKRAEDTVKEVLKRIPIANADAFRKACTEQVRFMNKLAVIAKRPYLHQIGIAAFRRVIKVHGLDIEIVRENGEQKLKFDPDPSRRWILLKLLDDDYLNSVMTRLKYEVNSKIARKVPAKATSKKS